MVIPDEAVESDHFNPYSFVYLPEKMNRVYRERIRKNQQSLITTYNLHEFMRHIAEGEDYLNKNLGLFGDLSQQKQCADILVR